MPWTTSACAEASSHSGGLLPQDDGYGSSKVLAASQLVHLRLSGATLELEDGSPVVQGVASSFWQSGSVLGAKGVVLGLENPQGSTSRVDCILGQVGGEVGMFCMQ